MGIETWPEVTGSKNEVCSLFEWDLVGLAVVREAARLREMMLLKCMMVGC